MASSLTQAGTPTVSPHAGKSATKPAESPTHREVSPEEFHLSALLILRNNNKDCTGAAETAQALRARAALPEDNSQHQHLHGSSPL